jgi:hypothetical protein
MHTWLNGLHVTCQVLSSVNQCWLLLSEMSESHVMNDEDVGFRNMMQAIRSHVDLMRGQCGSDTGLVGTMAQLEATSYYCEAAYLLVVSFPACQSLIAPLRASASHCTSSRLCLV